MAATKPKPKAKSYDNPNFKGFINFNLSEDDKAIIKGIGYTDSQFFGDLEKWIDNGFKFTFNREDRHGAWMVIGTRLDKEHSDYGVFLTGRGSTTLKAFKQWLYMASRIGESDWTDYLKPNERYEIDD